MNLRRVVFSSAAGCLLCGALLSVGGCPEYLSQYMISERTGNVTFQFINTTPFRASFSYGTWDSLDRSPPGTVTLLQLRLAANSTSTTSTAVCRRNAAIGTAEFVARVLATRADEAANFDADAFGEVVNFSSAPSNSDAAALPTEGTAAGREVLIGRDFSCGDRLVFTFVQDPDASGGFRIDFEVIKDQVRDRP
ncbi:MAG: hypothetical protein IPM13_03890 [Phycisphaerales bacterium]|nr:hypothetical protein [Phycisphaerales bacterium]